MIKCVFFDLGNVLVKVDKGAAIRQFTALTGLSADKLTTPEIGQVEIEFEKGRLTTEAYLRRIRQVLEIQKPLAAERLLSIWQAAFELQADVWRLAQNIRRTVPIWLLSNTNALHIRAIRAKYAILEQLDGLVLSYEVQALKPEPRIYLAALKQAAVAPEETIFIDDLPENVAGAAALGIHAHQFIDVATLSNYLRGYHLNA